MNRRCRDMLPARGKPECGLGPRLRSRSGIVITLVAVSSIALFPVLFWTWLDDTIGIMGLWDMWLFHGPRQFFSDFCIHQGEFPLWNPLVFCGMPHAANPQNLLLYPPNLLRSLLVFEPSPRATMISLWCLLCAHFVLMLTATFALGRRHGLSRTASLVGAVGVACSGEFILKMPAHPHFIFFMAWMPVVFLGLNRILGARSNAETARWTGVTALAFGMQVLTGFPLFMVYGTILHVSYAILSVLFAQDHRREAGAWRGAEVLRRAAQVLVPLAGVVVIGLLSAAVLLFPARTMSEQSARSKPMMSWTVPQARTVQELSLARALHTYLVLSPDPPVSKLLHVRSALASLLPLRAGLIVAVTAAFLRPRRRAMVFAILTMIAIDLTIGPPMAVASAAQWLAPFEFSSTAYGTILIAFPAAMVAACGVEALLRGTNRRTGLHARVLYAAGALGMLGLLVYPLKGIPWWGAPLAYICPAGVLAVLAAPRVLGGPGPQLAALLLLGETLMWGAFFDPVAIRDNQRNNLFQPDYLDIDARSAGFPLANSREVFGLPDAHLFALRASVNGYDPLIAAAANRALSCPEEEEHYHRVLWAGNVQRNPWLYLILKRPFWLARQYVLGEAPDKTRWFPPTTTVYLRDVPDLPVPMVSADSIPVDPVAEDPRETVIWKAAAVSAGSPSCESRGAARVAKYDIGPFGMPTAHHALHLRYRSDVQAELLLRSESPGSGSPHYAGPIALRATGELIEEIEWPLPDLTRAAIHLEVVLPGDAGGFECVEATLIEDTQDESESIRIVTRSANTTEVCLEGLRGYRILVFIDFYASGWHAYLDGAEVPILRAYGDFKAVAVPPGNHRVHFVFRAPEIERGLVFTLAALFIATALGLAPWLCGPRRARAAT